MNFKIIKMNFRLFFLYQSPSDHYMFSIFSGLDYSESFHIRHLYASGYLL